MTAQNVGEAILLRLKQLGVDYFFANPGTEFVSVIRGFERLPSESVPIPVAAPHEFQAVSMACGAYQKLRKPQAVMTHANVGAANALIGLIGAVRMNIPLILISGLTSSSERGHTGSRDKLIHWAQDSRDPAGLYRDYVKWDVEIHDASSVFDSLDRAFAIAMSPPYGPVAIRVSRDVLVAEEIPSLPARIQVQPVGLGRPSEVEAANLREALRISKRPLVITNRLGENANAVQQFGEVCSQLALSAATLDDFYMSLPNDHACHLGYQNTSALRDADLVITLDTDVPWYPIENGPAESAYVIHVGPDPLHSSIPLRSHRADLCVRSETQQFLALLQTFEIDAHLHRERMAWIESQRPPRSQAIGPTLTADSISSLIGEVLNEKTVLINELGLQPSHLHLKHPGSYFRSGSASPLGWGCGFAVGLGLAAPEKTLIAALGDGVFYLSPILGALATAAKNNLHLILVVLNNGGMKSIARTTQEFYRMDSPPNALSGPGADWVQFEKCAEVVGGLGLRANNVNEMRACLHQATKFVVNQKRPVVLNAIIGAL